jgi:signal transduction histidine kinase
MVALATRGIDLRYAARVAALAICYFAAARLSLVLAIPPGYATAVWPPSGIAFAALLIWGTSIWPGIWLGAALANYAVNGSAPLAATIATGNAFEGLCAAWLYVRLLGREFEFGEPETVFIFAAIAAVSSVVSATVGACAIHFSGATSSELFFANWYTWWQGDTTGIIVVTSCVLAWSRPPTDSDIPARRAELALYWVLLAATLASIFGHKSGDSSAVAMEFLLIPFMAWAGCRFNQRLVALAVLAATGTAIWGTVNGRGPYHSLSLNESLLALQAFTSTLALMGMLLYGVMRQRGHAIRVLSAERAWLLQIQAAQHDIAYLVAQMPSIDEALRGALRIVCEHLSWERGEYRALDEATGTLKAAASWRAAAPKASESARRAAPQAELERSHALSGLVRREKRPVWIEGAFAFPVTDGDKVLGVVEFFATGLRAPDRGLLDMSSSLGTLLGEFIGRMRADAQVSGYAQRMQTLSRRLADAQEAERRHVAVELQETVQRNLAAVKVELRNFAQTTDTRLQAGEAWIIQESLALLERTLAACDQLIAELRPAALGDGGLMPALRSCAARFERRTGIAVEVVGADAVSELEPAAESALLRIVQEALDNVVAHAQARTVRMLLDSAEGKTVLTLRDDGTGFDAAAHGEQRPAKGGLLRMRDTAEAARGKLRVESRPSYGTVITVEIPA